MTRPSCTTAATAPGPVSHSDTSVQAFRSCRTRSTPVSAHGSWWRSWTVKVPPGSAGSSVLVTSSRYLPRSVAEKRIGSGPSAPADESIRRITDPSGASTLMDTSMSRWSNRAATSSLPADSTVYITAAVPTARRSRMSPTARVVVVWATAWPARSNAPKAILSAPTMCMPADIVRGVVIGSYVALSCDGISRQIPRIMLSKD